MSHLGGVSHMLDLDAGHESQIFRLKHMPAQAVLTTSGANTALMPQARAEICLCRYPDGVHAWLH